MKHIPKHMKMPLVKNSPFYRKMIERKLRDKGYTIPSKYLGGK